jgi:hypothetical protein
MRPSRLEILVFAGTGLASIAIEASVEFFSTDGIEVNLPRRLPIRHRYSSDYTRSAETHMIHPIETLSRSSSPKGCQTAHSVSRAGKQLIHSTSRAAISLIRHSFNLTEIHCVTRIPL